MDDKLILVIIDKKYINRKLDTKTASRCCNFKLLEEKCILYKK